MSQLKILRGVPASGKSTEARELVNRSGFVRVNRDDIRYSMFGKYWGVDEDVVTTVENAMIESALRAGEDVVLDATNLNTKALKTKLSLASRYGAEVVYKDFPISLTDALNRDRDRGLNRERMVGEKVIRDFFRRYKIDTEHGVLPKAPTPLPFFEPYDKPSPYDSSKRAAYIVDTDGTVANSDGVRGPFETSKYHLDTVNEHVANAVYGLNAGGFAVIGLSGRDEEFREVTEKWWTDNTIYFEEFFMRPKGDKRLDAIVKYELFKEFIEPNYNVLGAFDDRPQVLRMWQTIGVPTFDVGPGTEF